MKITRRQIGTADWKLRDFPAKQLKQNLCCEYLVRFCIIMQENIAFILNSYSSKKKHFIYQNPFFKAYCFALSWRWRRFSAFTLFSQYIVQWHLRPNERKCKNWKSSISSLFSVTLLLLTIVRLTCVIIFSTLSLLNQIKTRKNFRSIFIHLTVHIQVNLLKIKINKKFPQSNDQ